MPLAGPRTFPWNLPRFPWIPPLVPLLCAPVPPAVWKNSSLSKKIPDDVQQNFKKVSNSVQIVSKQFPKQFSKRLQIFSKRCSSFERFRHKFPKHIQRRKKHPKTFENLQNRLMIFDFFSKCPNTSERIQTHPSHPKASDCSGTPSERVQTQQKKSRNFPKN